MRSVAIPKTATYLRVEILLGLVLVIAACNAGTTSTPVRETITNPAVVGRVFEGFYETAADLSSFVPCEMNELPDIGKGYWLIPNDEFSRLYEHPEGITTGDIGGTYGPYDKFAIYVRFEGNLSPAGDAESGKGYGHLGLYARAITVTKALEAKRIWVGSAAEEAAVDRRLCP